MYITSRRDKTGRLKAGRRRVWSLPARETGAEYRRHLASSVLRGCIATPPTTKESRAEALAYCWAAFDLLTLIDHEAALEGIPQLEIEIHDPVPGAGPVRYLMVLADAGGSSIPATQRLRAALKSLLRVSCLRCVELRAEPAEVRS